MKQRGYQLGDSIGQAGVEATYDTLPPRPRRHGAAARSTRAAGRRARSSRTTNPRPGQHAPAHARPRPPARGRAGARATASSSRTRAADRLGGGRRRDRRARPARRRGARDGVVPDVSSRRSTSAATRRSSRRSRTTRSRARTNYPGLNRAIDVAYPPGSTWKPVTALAAMQEHLLTPYSSLLLHADYTRVRPGRSTTGRRTSTSWIDAADRARRVVRHVLLPARRATSTSCRANRGHPLQNWASRFGFGAPTGIDVGPEVAGPRADARVALRAVRRAAVLRRRRPHLEAGLLDPDGDRPGRPHVTPLQMARFYAMIANGGQLVTPHIAEDVEQSTGDPTGSRRCCRRFGAQPPQPTGVDPTALAVVQQRPLRGDALADRHVVGRLRHVPGRHRRQDGHAPRSSSRCRAIRHAPEPDQSWWCGYGPVRERRRSSSARVIENGGHGGTAAAPAALKVFEQYFGKTRPRPTHASD